MEDRVEDIESIDPHPEREEPWCKSCHSHTDYRRKWGTVTRGDLDGRSYSEVYEIPHCIKCEKPMLFISSSRRLVYFVNALAILAWVIGFLCVTYLFEFGIASIFGLLVHAGICVLISRFPRQSRLTLSSWKRTKRDKALQELLKQI